MYCVRKKILLRNTYNSVIIQTEISEFKMSILHYCRLCLSTDCKLINIRKNGLNEILGALDKTLVTNKRNISPYMCTLCWMQLRRAATFKNKCLHVQKFLENALENGPITQELLNNTDKSHLILLNLSNVSILEYVDDNLGLNVDIKEDVEIKDEHGFKAEEQSTRKDTLNSCNGNELNNYINALKSDCNNIIAINNENVKTSSQNDVEVTKIYETLTHKKKDTSNQANQFKYSIKIEHEDFAKVNKVRKNKKDKLDKRIDNDSKKNNDTNNHSEELAAEAETVHNETVIDDFVSKKSGRQHYVEFKYDDGDDKDDEMLLVNFSKKKSYLKKDNFSDSNNDNLTHDIIENITEDVATQDNDTINESNDNLETDDFFDVSIETKSKTKKKAVTNKAKSKTKKRTVVTKDKDVKASKTHYSHQVVVDKFRNKYNFDVIELTTEEQNADWMLRANNPHYRSSAYSCNLCYRWFATEKVYKKHLLVHDKSGGTYICNVCKVRFRLRKQFAAHFAKIHKYKFVCNTCGETFNHTHNAKCHYLQHEGKNYVCQHCGKIFDRYKTHLQHVQFWHGAVRCALCYRRVSSRAALALHNTRMHQEVFTCATCSVSFDNKSALTRHIAAYGYASQHALAPCCACGDNFKDHTELERHIEIHVPRRTGRLGRKKGSRNKKKCCPCGHINVDDLPKSTETDNLATPSEFPIKDGTSDTKGYDNTYLTFLSDSANKDSSETKCSEVTSEVKSKMADEVSAEECNCPCKRKMEVDGIEITKKKKLICEFCANVFQSDAALRYHLLIHTGEKQHQCEVCSKRFTHKCNLTTHMTVHTGERAYKCDYCEKAFKSHYSKHRHELIHSKKRPYSCDVCGKTFQTSSYVKTHVRTVHMKMPWPRRVRNRRQDK